jgi:regulatory protein
VARDASDKPQLSLKTQALKLLARREHTRVELRDKLSALTEDTEAVEGLLVDLAERGWLSDARVIEQVSHARRRRFGSQRIRRELLNKGVPTDLVAAALPELQAGDITAATAVWRRKFRELPQNASERARHLRFLQGRGFSMDVALKVLRAAAVPADEDEA